MAAGWLSTCGRLTTRWACAICALAIHYAADRHAAFAEFGRVLRPGDVLIAALRSCRYPCRLTGEMPGIRM